MNIIPILIIPTIGLALEFDTNKDQVLFENLLSVIIKQPGLSTSVADEVLPAVMSATLVGVLWCQDFSSGGAKYY